MTKIQRRGYTDHLNRRPAENICHAFDYAEAIGRPLNNYVVVNLRGEAADNAASIFERVRHKFRDWFNRRTRQLYGASLAPMYVYTLECPNGMAHANWVTNIPPALQSEFERKLDKWVDKAQGRVGPFDACLKPVKAGTAKTLAKYLLKGIDPLYVGYLHLDAYAAPQGRIWGRRAGASPAISRAARRAAGFVAKRHRKSWRTAA